MTLATGAKLGRYEIASLIGVGGMGEVYLARDTKLDRSVAIKFLNEEFSKDADKLNRFIQEAKAASALNHPNILTIHEIGEIGGLRFMASEYIEGQTLTELLRQEKPTLIEVLQIAIQIVSALQAAHEAGIVHRDIKPDNVMIRRDGIVKVLDFGLAKLSEPPASARGFDLKKEAAAGRVSTIPGIIMGTPNYMSPEQARGKDIDHQTDIFSFGVVLYGMLSGSSPFAGDTISDIIASVLTKEPKPLREINQETPVALEIIVHKALQKDKEQRYQTAQDLLDDLKEVKQELEVQSHLQRTAAVNRAEMKTQILKTQSLPEINQADVKQANLRSNSIAVLPFSDISPDSDNKYFSDGLTEEVIMNLSKLQGLKVLVRGSTMRYVKEGKLYKQAADDLGVQYLLDGSVRRHGQDLRITAQLVDTDSDVYLWAETYRGTMEDIFEIQEKVAAEIVRALQVRLSRDEKQILKKRFTENAEAYQLYLQGRYFWNKRSEDGLKTAIKYFKKAIKKDPKYALAWAGVADSYSLLGEYGNIPRKELYPKAQAAAEKALAIDNRLAEVHASLAMLHMLKRWDWPNAEKEFKLAIELNPNYATAHHWYSQWLVCMGRLEEAFQSISRAAELDPVSQAILKDKGLTLYYSRQYNKAIAMARRTLELDPNYAAAHRLLSLSYQGKGLFKEAIAENQHWGTLTGNEVETTVALAQLYAVSGQGEEAKKLIAVVEKDKLTDNICRGLALVYAALGEHDIAFKWLGKSYERREEALLNLKVDPKADRLRSDPRFSALLKKLGVEK
jgi:serine/threonine protein kinase/Tfp pilus assembly protein PilF